MQVISPTSQEQFCLAMSSAESYDGFDRQGKLIYAVGFSEDIQCHSFISFQLLRLELHSHALHSLKENIDVWLIG